MAAFAGLCFGLSNRSSAAIDSGSADTNYNSFKNTFLYWSGNTAFFHNAIGSSVAEDGWVAALEILAVEDVYERTQSPNEKKLVDDLCNTFLSRNSPSNWSQNNWNDDIGWYTLAMIRGYQITGTQNQLTQAEYGFNMAYNRGWDTQYNGGGVWQVQPSAGPNPHKDPLSNNSLGKVAALIYQSTGDSGYLTKANNLYNWAWHNIYDPNSGQVYCKIFQDGSLDKTLEAYNQGTWADFANIMHDITGNVTYLNDAQKTLDFTKSNVTTNGVLVAGSGYIVTWADEVARAVGHVCRKNPSLWAKYWPWMKQNADAIWDNRRTDDNITWNYWNQKTSTSTTGTSQFISALAWLQYTPASNPGGGGSTGSGGIAGTHSIINVQNGEAVDNAGSNTQNAGIILWANNGGNAQKWNFTQNSDTSWNIVSVFSGQALNDGNSSANGAQMIQYGANSNDNNQRWWVDKQSDGTYKIWNKVNSKSLDSGNKSGNNLPLIQWDYNGGSQQRWNLQ